MILKTSRMQSNVTTFRCNSRNYWLVLLKVVRRRERHFSYFCSIIIISQQLSKWLLSFESVALPHKFTIPSRHININTQVLVSRKKARVAQQAHLRQTPATTTLSGSGEKKKDKTGFPRTSREQVYRMARAGGRSLPRNIVGSARDSASRQASLSTKGLWFFGRCHSCRAPRHTYRKYPARLCSTWSYRRGRADGRDDLARDTQALYFRPAPSINKAKWRSCSRNNACARTRELPGACAHVVSFLVVRWKFYGGSFGIYSFGYGEIFRIYRLDDRYYFARVSRIMSNKLKLRRL